MFVDLDWPLNASSLLSASAELLVGSDIRLKVIQYDLVDVHIWSYYCSWWFQFKKCVCPVVCVCNCHVVKRWVVHISSICDCDWCWYDFCDFCTLLVFRSTAVVLCNYNKNTFVCSYVVCTCANTFAMLCICREFHGVSVLWSKAWRW